MSLYDQIWSQEDYVPRKQVYLHELPRNHINKLKTVKFDFDDYKVYEKLGCLPYERMMVRCINNYGANFVVTNAECREIALYFKECVQRNHVFGRMKRTMPEYYANSQYSRDKPNFSELANQKISSTQIIQHSIGVILRTLSEKRIDISIHILCRLIL